MVIVRLRVLVPYPEFLKDLRQAQETLRPENLEGMDEAQQLKLALSLELSQQMLRVYIEHEFNEACLLIYDWLWHTAYDQVTINPDLEFEFKELYGLIASQQTYKSGKLLDKSTLRKVLKTLERKKLIQRLDSKGNP